jgi:hypothetical protein
MGSAKASTTPCEARTFKPSATTCESSFASKPAPQRFATVPLAAERMMATESVTDVGGTILQQSVKVLLVHP